MPAIVLYDEVYSPTCAKIRKLLEHKGLRYRTIPVPYHDKERLLKDTGQDYVPFLRDGHRGVPWTRAVDYLEGRAPEPSAYPNGTRGVCKILEAWEYDWFEARLWGLVAPFLEPRFADPVERWNFTETWERVYGPFDEIRRAPGRIWEGLAPSFALLEDALRGRDYLVTSAPTAFDFAIYGDLFAMEFARIPVPAKYPRLRRWYRRVASL